MSHLLEVKIENHYVDDVDPADDWPDAMVAKHDDGLEVKRVEETFEKPSIFAVTLEIEVPDLPSYGTTNDEWDEWANDMILPFTGVGRPEGDAGYFAEITDVLPPSEGYTVDRSEFAHVIGRTFEWGV